ncbi:16S rRNA (guanine(966)-N(2))-methyltransferase RsmD [Paenarthrobacter sp. Z7-10]|uniref:16S rRNA (guanine(966)-N(2))-methyltransferase RsmD n=1 Tax=Paenarthrobacter sp. Z7-10 TaxID=2787635 RepID=UPI0022A97D0A|nr:16S rRNA (guanine(966)-N(2))-methyltransferase RsmD [Paenarthrobacter sp. Z7-10]MCZ2403458.1 16S rRNA (guanine(966)-N(2))-methyltransferase RsmD [Paenarthrobacter sp. Z7-10]
MTRIVAGIAGGTPLASVLGTGTRPTTDRVKEALFSRLESLDALLDARVLDLYAGSGSLGVESASRGAASVKLVEYGARAAEVCQRNATAINDVLGRKVVTVQRSKVESFLGRVAEAGVDQWDLVFLDPPYPLAEDGLTAVLAALAPNLAAEAVVVVERSSRSPEPGWTPALERFAEKKYGETKLWFAGPALVD